ncbi:MAG: SDR family oxidoreductase, partial [Nitrospinaceae bacterium]|nr:SDR family oxidoreductase [Nitrospinaceae bacterium]
VLITGGAGDIGRAAAARFAEEGAWVVLLDTDEVGLSRAASEIKGASYRRVDVTDLADVEAVFSAVFAEFDRIDVLVNGAGIYRHSKVLDMSMDEWRETMDVNLTGVFAASKVAGALMMAQEPGSVIVNLASVAAKRGSPLHAHYCASKAGLVGFSRALAMELAPRVRVNSVAPGIIEGRMIASMMAERGESWRAQIPLDRFGTPADVAKAICFLASDRASYINGAVLNVNGGMFMD